MKLTVATPEDMEELGARLAGRLRAGDVVALNGELGAGKTTLTRGLGRALGVQGAVTSPTFVLARTHPTVDGVPLVHVDAYRLSGAADLDDLDLDYEGSIVVVEWASGMLDGVAGSWIDVDIVRPTGAGTGNAGGTVLGEAAPATSPAAADAVFDEAEPREVTITGHGDRFEDFRL